MRRALPPALLFVVVFVAAVASFGASPTGGLGTGPVPAGAPTADEAVSRAIDAIVRDDSLAWRKVARFDMDAFLDDVETDSVSGVEYTSSVYGGNRFDRNGDGFDANLVLNPEQGPRARLVSLALERNPEGRWYCSGWRRSP